MRRAIGYFGVALYGVVKFVKWARGASIWPSWPRAHVVADMAVSAALDDPGFPPLTPGTPGTGFPVEISVLTPLKRIRDRSGYRLHEHGRTWNSVRASRSCYRKCPGTANGQRTGSGKPWRARPGSSWTFMTIQPSGCTSSAPR